MTSDFIVDRDDNFEFSQGKRDINFSVLHDGVVVTIDQHNTGWDQGGWASIFVPNDKWNEFVQNVNNLKVKT